MKNIGKDKQKCDKDAIRKRLNRIEGQIKGVQKMVDEGKFCVEILIQVAAIRSALDKVGGIILDNHVKRCIKETLESDETSVKEKDELVDELVGIILKFMRPTSEEK